MRTPVGPTLQLVVELADAFAEVTLARLERAWKERCGAERLPRKLAQFTAAGWLESPAGPGDGRDRIVRLTEAGRRAAVGGRNPETQWARPWDGRWRMALFDVPEAQRVRRVRFARALRALHFGCLQNSVWVSPDPMERLREAIAGTDLHVETLTLMEARPCGGESAAALVAGAWDFTRINQNYRAGLDLLASEPKDRSSRAWRAWLGTEWQAWAKALREDPLLPAALLPAGYLGREAWRRRRAHLRQRFTTG